MSTENNTPVESQEEDLDLFASDFFSRKTPEPETTNSDDEDPVTTEDSDATNETQTDDEDDDTLAPEDDDAEDKADEPAPKKTRFQERIDELTAKAREAERREQAMQAKLDEIISKQNEKPVTPPTPVVEDNGPTPDAKNEDGTDKYPLGEFDPNYLKDSMKHMLQQERRTQEEQDKARQAQEKQDAEQAALLSTWNEKLTPAKEKYPDFQEKGQALLSTFESINEAYGEYLTATLMSMDYGPDVLYYLSNNPEEAQRIVDSGPQRASIALGRIEAKFADFEEAKQTARPKVSKAPTPPPANKGASPAVGTVALDTDDLDAFANLLFKKK